ncbi:hypothetical protein EJ04DRAFT_575492 [Polyplosphaeria fusca]|uniref:DUF1279 domain-containing protein n=1 Tax=Polyplosphaeria fusca TaxID=682080 RepID=A0A9P4V1H4_9PLEO|nr:hypothetical protein EJ04DRAFT_575492 [Polyplosphaeria fusca]
MRAARVWAERPLLRRPVTRTSTLRSFFTTLQTASTRQSIRSTERCLAPSPRPQLLTSSRRFRFRRWKSDPSTPSQRPNPTQHLGSPEPAPSLSQRLRKLSREYGWSALGVYFALTALDLPLCFVAVRTVGTEKIGHYEHVVVESLRSLVAVVFPSMKKEKDQEPLSAEVLEATAREGDVGLQHIDAAEAANSGDGASIWTQLALAYAIHKAFIFVRVPATVAMTPKVVKTLRGWGWDIGKRKPKSK